MINAWWRTTSAEICSRIVLQFDVGGGKVLQRASKNGSRPASGYPLAAFAGKG
jgi:hypothetical protein